MRGNLASSVGSISLDESMREPQRTSIDTEKTAVSSKPAPLLIEASLKPIDTHCHQLAALFNTLKTNDVIFVETQEDTFNSSVDHSVLKNVVRKLSL